MPALASESVGIAGFILVAVIGFKRNLWLVVGVLFFHGIFDFFHADVIVNAGVPAWWPMFCLAYDVTAAGYLDGILLRRRSAFRS